MIGEKSIKIVIFFIVFPIYVLYIKVVDMSIPIRAFCKSFYILGGENEKVYKRLVLPVRIQLP